MTLQARNKFSGLIISSKSSGRVVLPLISRHAPVFDRLRIRHSSVMPLIEILPDLKVRERGSRRASLGVDESRRSVKIELGTGTPARLRLTGTPWPYADDRGLRRKPMRNWLMYEQTFSRRVVPKKGVKKFSEGTDVRFGSASPRRLPKNPT